MNVARRVRRNRRRVGRELRRSLTERHSPQQVAGSFALGTFITMLPTLGVGLLVFVVLSTIISSINKVALFASVLVFNPVVKWGVYASSVTLGFLLLGPVDGLSTTDVSLSAGPPIILRLLIGNLILAVIASILAYVVVLYLASRYGHAQWGEIIDEAIDDIADEVVQG